MPKKTRSNLLNRFKRLIKQLRGKDLWTFPEKSCNNLRFGNWCICQDNITENSIVYSLGVGEDIHFDVGMIKKFGVNVFAFDPTPNTIEWVKQNNTSEKFNFFPYGIASSDKKMKFFPRVNKRGTKSKSMFTVVEEGDALVGAVDVQMHKLSTVMNELGHKKIDILKMDVESSEYEIIDEICESNIQIDQILVEYHHHFVQIDKLMTKNSIKKLKSKGYEIFFISEKGKEYSFIKSGI